MTKPLPKALAAILVAVLLLHVMFGLILTWIGVKRTRWE